jgi:uncharacterized membrane protein (DUF2068 family)
VSPQARAGPVIGRSDARTLGHVKDTGVGSGLVTAIGVFKLVKTAILLTLGVWAVARDHDHFAHSIAHAARWTGAFSGREVVQEALARVLSLDAHTIHRLGIASIIYAAVFAVEGVGLVMRLRWAEWLTVGVTGSFVPLEIYELVHRPGPGKGAALVINLAIVAYLVWRRLEARRASRAQR